MRNNLSKTVSKSGRPFTGSENFYHFVCSYISAMSDDFALERSGNKLRSDFGRYTLIGLYRVDKELTIHGGANWLKPI